MVAIEPELSPDDLEAELEEGPPNVVALGPYATCTRLSAADRALLDNVAGHLPLLADLTHADAVLFAVAEDQVVVVAQAQPVPVPSPYALPVAIGRTMAR